MPRYKFTIEYDGAPFVGWQRQNNGASVQGALEAALAAIGETTAVTGAGRTDAGVHAIGQVGHADLSRDWDPFRLSEALNQHLRPNPIALRAVERAREDFHARFDAIERSYLYLIAPRRAPLTLSAGRAWRIGHELDVDAMRAGAARLIGKWDFTTFRSSQCQSASPVKTLDAIDIAEERDFFDARHIAIRVRARSFLHNQVRSFVGTLERVGAGKWTADDVSSALAARDRAACGPVAPARGLYLDRVTYEQSR